ncbi:hypothetical protein VTL71DRAFT_1305 [Oculimacula yallundae]|uniref:Uncharacterized protein n=1 Tax=Oculimacula yallundae TaxID=86028 RepID=A0ABR4CAD0_9HELO
MILAFTAPCMGIVTPTNAATDFRKLRVGVPFTISWSGATGDVTIALLLASGATVVTIGSAIAGNSYVWTPPALSKTDRYILQFVDQTLVKSESVSFDFSEDPDPSARDASSLLVPSTIRSQPPTSTNSQTSSTIAVTKPTMSSSLVSSTVQSQQTSSTTTSAQTATSSSHHGGLSAGAKAGISVGAILGVLLLVCLVLLGFWIGRRTARHTAMNNDRNRNDMEENEGGRGWYGQEKPNYDPGSTGSRHNLLKKAGDGGMGTMTTDGRSSRMDTMTFSDGRSSRLDTITMVDERDLRLNMTTPPPPPMSPMVVSPLRMSPVDGRTSRVSILSDGRRTRIGRFEFEDMPDARGFSGGIRIVEMESFKI